MQLHCGFQLRRPNSGGVPLSKDYKICLMVVMAYVLSVQQGLKNKVEKKKIYRNKPFRLAISYFKQGLSIVKAKVWSLKRFISVLNNIFKMLTKENSCISSIKSIILKINTHITIFSPTYQQIYYK